MEGPWVPAGWVGGDEASGTVPGAQKQHFCYSVPGSSEQVPGTHTLYQVHKDKTPAAVYLVPPKQGYCTNQDSYYSVPGSPEQVSRCSVHQCY